MSKYGIRMALSCDNNCSLRSGRIFPERITDLGE